MFIVVHAGVQLMQHHSLKRLPLLLLSALTPLLKISWLYMCLQSLFYYPVCLLSFASVRLPEYHRLTTGLKVLLHKVSPNFVFLFLLLKIASVFLGHVCFWINFRISLSVCTQKVLELWLGLHGFCRWVGEMSTFKCPVCQSGDTGRLFIGVVFEPQQCFIAFSIVVLGLFC